MVKKTLIHTLVLLTVPLLAAHASHTQADETGWFEYQYNESDDAVLYCNALGYITIGDLLYIHDRPGEEGISGTVDTGGGGTYIAMESNGIPGYQIGEPGFLVGPFSDLPLMSHSEPFGDVCPNGDTVLF